MSVTARRGVPVVWVIRLYLAAVFGWLIWGWIVYAGPFKWMAEWELQQFGFYGLKVTFLVPLLVLWVPAMVVAQRFGVLDQVFGTKAGGPGQPRRRWAGRLALLALLPLAVCVGAGAWLAAPHAPPTTATLDLLAGDVAPPGADLVDVTGVVQLGRGIEVTSTETVDDKHSYMPMTGLRWTGEDPVRYVLAWKDRADGAPLQPDANAVIRVDGAVLERDGLPGLVREAFRRDLRLAEPVYLVRPGGDPNEAWLTATISGGILAVSLLFSAAILAVIERVQARRA